MGQRLMAKKEDEPEPEREIDNSVLGDAESMCRAAAYRLFKAMRLPQATKERHRLIGEARALLHGVEARIR